MPLTPNYDLPYPTLASTADVPSDLEDLAVATDAALDDIATETAATFADLYRTGIATVASDATYKNETTINFADAGFTLPPYVVATIAGDRDKRIVTITASTATTAEITVHTADGSALGNATSVYWLAMRRN
jgi:hypothetical protein